MSKKWISLLLSALLLLASCSGGADTGTEGGTPANEPGGTSDQTTEAEAPETEPAPETEDPATLFDLEVKDYGGKNVGILGTNWYNIASNWTSPELKVTELTGEAMNDAVYNRNQNIQSKYNVKLVATDGGAYLDSAIHARSLPGPTPTTSHFPGSPK